MFRNSSSRRKAAAKNTDKQAESQKIKFLAYALPRNKNDNGSRVIQHDGYELHDEPLEAPVSFLDFDGIVIFAGSFERYHTDAIGFTEAFCLASADLDRRERE